MPASQSPAADGSAASSSPSAPPSDGDALPSGIFSALWEDVRGLVSDHVLLLSLELRRVRHTVAQLVVLVLVASILALSAWIAAWAMVVALLRSAGLPPEGALALVLLLNAAGAWLAIQRARGLLDRLSLPATQRRLSFAPPPEGVSAAAAQAVAERAAP